MQAVTFAPGRSARPSTCRRWVTRCPVAAPTTSYKKSVCPTPRRPVLGRNRLRRDRGFVRTTGITGTATPAPPVGVPGDVLRRATPPLAHPGKASRVQAGAKGPRRRAERPRSPEPRLTETAKAWAFAIGLHRPSGSAIRRNSTGGQWTPGPPPISRGRRIHHGDRFTALGAGSGLHLHGRR